MILLDTNVLVYAVNADAPQHSSCQAVVQAAFDRQILAALVPQILLEFLAIVTHPRIYAPPTNLAAAIDQVDAWLESPSLTLLAESEGYWRELKSMMRDGRIAGPHVHDARVAALCRLHGVRELWTADRDFSRFRGLEFRNPLVP